MRRLLLCIALLLCLNPARVWGQPAPDEEERDQPAPDEEERDQPAPGEEGEADSPFGAPRLRAPDVEPPDVGTGAAPAPEEPQAGEEGEEQPQAGEESEEQPAPPPQEEGADEEEASGDASPGAVADLLDEAEPGAEDGAPSSDPTLPDWTAPESVLTLHGYLRVRGEIWDNFMLDSQLAGQEPFRFFAPADRDSTVCDEGAMDPETCGGSRLRFANMRMRLRPTLSVSDDVRVHMMVDVFDNLVLGSTPNSEGFVPNPGDGSAFSRTEGRSPGQPIDSFASTQDPPSALRNSFQDSIRVRRAWAEVKNRGIGQLRFGRMGSHWGLGIFHNSGEGIDADYQTDVDRIMGVTKLAGFYLIAAWDWAGEGILRQDVGDSRRFAFDATSRDDVRQWVLAIARRTDEEEQRARLERGDWVLNGGLFFVMRKQSVSSAGASDPFASTAPSGSFFRRDMRSFTPDLWGQFLWKDLRLEAEAVLRAGEIENVVPTASDGDEEKLDLLQFGFAFESEYRMLDDKLGIYLYTGLATGDEDVDGLSSRENMLTQNAPPGDDRISTFAFHRNYRIDLILWRNIMERVAGAWYLRPGVSYDFLHNSFGQRLGARFDMIYSRAAREVQTYGSDPNLGLEMDLSAYYQSEDGPELMDGFHAMAQFGILFPFAGLGEPGPDAFDPGRAWVFRTVLGVQF